MPARRGRCSTGKSLLPIGVTRVTGELCRAATRSRCSMPTGVEIARGLVGLDSDEAQLVKGKKSQSVVELLGVGHRGEIIHRDNLVLLQRRGGQGA